MSRGVERRPIFRDVNDRHRFLALLANAVTTFHWRLYAFVLMTNHFHLLIETVDPTLSRGMKRICGDYADAFNWRHSRVGHLFQGRFKSHLVDSETYLLEVARYIVLNPVRAKLIDRLDDYEWSSYPATAGLANPPAWLACGGVLERFHPDRARAASEYRQFVGAKMCDANSPWTNLVGQIYLGSSSFIAKVQQKIDAQPRSDQHAREQRVVRSATPDDVERAVREVTGVAPSACSPRDIRFAYALALRIGALASLRVIAARLAVTTTGASYLVGRARELRRCSREFDSLIERIVLVTGHCKVQM